MKKINSQKGITLVALVITIVVLLILSGITIAQLTGNGLFEKAQLAEEETLKQTAREKINFKITGVEMEIWAEKQRMPTLQNLADEFCNDNDFQYVELTKQKTSSILPAIKVGNNESIFVKLKDYEYEFEIDKNLRLASIDGEKVEEEIKDKDNQGSGDNQDDGTNTKLQNLADKCSVGDYVQYSANNVSKWRVWDIKDDKSVQIISANGIESYNPKSSYANMEKHLGDNEYWKKYENSFAITGSALGGTTKELYEKNYNICLDVCKYTKTSGAKNLALFSKRNEKCPWVALTTGVINTGGDDGNNLYSLRPVVTLKSDVFVDQDEVYDSSTGWKIE